MTPSEFVKSLKMKRSLSKNLANLDFGDEVLMNHCKYVVKSPRGAGQTILEDETGGRVAIPLNRMSILIKTGIAKHNAQDIYKATPPSNSKTPSAKGDPVGTMKQGSDGMWRKKISSNPSVWVHMANGTAHSSHDAKESFHPLMDDKSRQNAMKVYSKILRHAHPEDHDKLKKKFMDYITELSAYKNLSSAHNAPELDESGNRQSKTALSTSQYNSIYKRQDAAEQHLKEFVDSFKSSIKKKKQE